MKELENIKKECYSIIYGKNCTLNQPNVKKNRFMLLRIVWYGGYNIKK